MKKPDTKKRKYDSSRRKAQARETRRLIVESAKTLFITRGYDGTTIDAIAEKASVSPETLYAVFKNKRNILKHLLDVSIGGDDQPIGLMVRPEQQAVLQASNPNQQIEMFAHGITEILVRVAPLFEVLRTAAKMDKELQTLAGHMLKERLENMTMLVEQLKKNGGLRDELEIPQAAELVWTITSPEVFLLLTRDQGYSQEKYIQWLKTNLGLMLLQ